MKMTVHLPGEEYDILAGHGMAARAGEVLALNRRVLVVTDDGVPPAYAARVCEDCAHPVPVCLPAGEASKSMDGFATLLRAMTDAGFTRTDAVVAVGGGVVGDLSGFAASCYMRGVDFYNIPTTLLSQVDSSVGGKTAINFAGIKNIVGSFYQPKRVLIDPDFLSTLPPEEIRCGLAEILKTGVILDEALFAALEREPETLRDGRNPERFVPLIRRSCELKAQVVAADERESGIRALLNYGHTFGHAVELLSDFRISHGEGVAIGMCCAGELAVRLGRWSRAEAERQKRAIAALGLATQLPRHCSVPAMLEAMHRDKKNRGGAVTLVLPKRIGEAETVRTVPDSEIASALEVLYD